MTPADMFSPRGRAELQIWPAAVERLARRLADLDLQLAVCNPTAAAALRLQANRVAAQLEALKQLTLEAETVTRRA